MKRYLCKRPVTSAIDSMSSGLTLDDVLAAVREDGEFLLETEDAVYLTDPSAAELPGVFKVTHDNIIQTIDIACQEWGDDVTAEDIVSDWLYYYATQCTLEELDAAYMSVGQELPEEFLA